MSSTYDQYYHYSDQNVVLATNAFPYVQYDSQRSKTPTSLINHSGHSPGPLSTPPGSRNPSQPPEQPPDQMIWDDVSGSLSNSPTSVRTPDNDSFEAEMLDAPEAMRTFYQNQNGAMASTQMSQDSIPSIDSTFYFPDQGMLLCGACISILSF